MIPIISVHNVNDKIGQMQLKIDLGLSSLTLILLYFRLWFHAWFANKKDYNLLIGNFSDIDATMYFRLRRIPIC